MCVRREEYAPRRVGDVSPRKRAIASSQSAANRINYAPLIEGSVTLRQNKPKSVLSLSCVKRGGSVRRREACVERSLILNVSDLSSVRSMGCAPSQMADAKTLRRSKTVLSEVS